LLRTVILETTEGNKNIRALFDTGANVFILSQERVQIYNIFVMEREKPISLLGFSGQQETSFGKYFTPLINFRIAEHVFLISCEIGPLEKRGDLIIPGRWLLVEHPMSFQWNEIQVKQYLCDPESIILYDETVSDDEETVWIGLLMATQAPNNEQIKEIVPEEYHNYLKLFGEPLV
jgi:hypothetical protein